MRLVQGYVRVSSVEQEQGFGPEAQADRIHRYASEKGLEPVQISHESKSGESLTNRFELHGVLARAEAAVEQGGEAHIIFPGLDRLTRDLIDQEGVVTRSFRTGVRLHSTLPSENDTLDPAYAGDPMRTAIRQFFGVINQLDRAIIQRRLDGGLARKAAGGGFTGGRVPFGYRSVDQELVIDPEGAPVVRRIFALARHGVDQGTIAAIIAGEAPACRHWRKQQVSRVLEREPLYARGVYRPRGGDLEVSRPDLVILVGEEGPQAAVGVDWSKLPDPVRLSGLVVMLGRPEAELRSLISQHGLLVRWRGKQPLVPLASVARLRDLLGQK